MRYARSRSLFNLLAVAAVLTLVACGQSVDDIRNWPKSSGPIVVIGDSLVAGSGAGQGEDFPAVMEEELGVEVVNRGLPGATTRDLAELAIQIFDLEEEPRLVVVAAGGNDIRAQFTPEETRENLVETVRDLQAGGAMVAIVGYRFGPGHWDQRNLAKEVAEERGAWYVDDPLDGIFNDPSYKADQVHLNARGYRIVGQRVAEGIRPLLEGPAGP